MDRLIELLAIGLAGWRTAALLTYERGPWDVFLRLRRATGIDHDDSGVPISWPDRFLPRLLSCVWCGSMYTTAAAWGLWRVSPEAVMIFAGAALAVAVERWVRG